MAGVALRAVQPQKTVGEDPALQVAAQFSLDMGRQGMLAGARALEKDLQVIDQDAIEEIKSDQCEKERRCPP